MDSKEPPRYVYKPLLKEQGSIRLLELEPTSEIDAPIRCRLRRTKLRVIAGRFAALSYAWGDAANPATVELDNFQFSVGRNLFQFLKRLRQAGHTIVWADAICVNQEDLPERSQQVILMQQIFSQAGRVVAYLGEDADDSDLAFEYLIRWSQLSHPAPESQQMKSVYESLFEENKSLPLGDALARICERAYFSRLWIVQELALPSENSRLVFYCGNRCVSSGDFGQISKHIPAERHFWRLRQKTPKIKRPVPEALSRLGSLFERPESNPFRHIRDFKGGHDHVIDLALEFAEYSCLDPRDHVYALLGIARGANHVKIDYAQPALGLFLDLMYLSDQELYRFRSEIPTYRQLWKMLRLELLDTGIFSTFISDSDLVARLAPSSNLGNGRITSHSTTEQLSVLRKFQRAEQWKVPVLLGDPKKITFVGTSPPDGGLYETEGLCQTLFSVTDYTSDPLLLVSRELPRLGDTMMNIRGTDIFLVYRIPHDFTRSDSRYIGCAIRACWKRSTEISRLLVAGHGYTTGCTQHYARAKFIKNLGPLFWIQTSVRSWMASSLRIPVSDLVYLLCCHGSHRRFDASRYKWFNE